MGSILVSPAFNPEIVIGNSNQYRNAASSVAELDSLLTEVRNALAAAETSLADARTKFTNATTERDNFAKDGKVVAGLTNDLLTDYEKWYVKHYRPWYDSGKEEGDSLMNNLIQEIVVKRKYKQGTWGNQKVEGAPKYSLKKNAYDRVYKRGTERFRYWFQQNQVVVPFIQELIAAKRAYDSTLKTLNENVVKRQTDLNIAQKAFNDQQSLVTKTATDLETARNLPEMTKIAADAKTASDKIAADADVAKAQIAAQSEATRARNRMLIIGGAAVVVIGIGAYLFLRR